MKVEQLLPPRSKLWRLKYKYWKRSPDVIFRARGHPCMSVSDFVAVKRKKKKIIVSSDIRVKNGGNTSISPLKFGRFNLSYLSLLSYLSYL